MSFCEIYSRYKDVDTALHLISSKDVEKALQAQKPSIDHFLSLLSPAAHAYLEEMAARAREITLRYFGKTMQLYTPLYLSNYCDNACAYCGFNTANSIERRKLSIDEVEEEARAIARTGLKTILILTGESRQMSPLTYIKECVRILKKQFSSISVEIYALTEIEYAELVGEGVDGLTIYQEAYDEEIYKKMHPAGPKSDYKFRLDSPERGARAGMRNINIGILLGLDDWRGEAFWLGLHADYLQDRFPGVELGVSLPRVRPHAGSFTPAHEVDDRAMVQIITALRIFSPRLGISMSTRERSDFRENLIAIGLTRMSAGSSTYVGGHAASIAKQPFPNPARRGGQYALAGLGSNEKPQFEISDKRSVSEMMVVLQRKGYQPVLKDWMHI